MGKRAVVILAEGFEEIEAITSIDVLRRAEIEVTVAGLNGLTVKGSRGVTVTADKTLAEAGVDYDACVLPGGMPGASNLAASEKVNALIKKLNEEGKIVAAICASPAVVLAPAGALNNKSATCYPGMQESFDSSSVYKEEDVVVDANIITSRGPATALVFALAIARELAGKETSSRLKNALLLD
jgi:4-methyl-5(b-hydroxyethyl)-thiazole monophosphate biosynthesis